MPRRGSSGPAHDGAPELSAFDARLASEMQDDFPISLRPFHELAERVGTTEGQVIVAARRMRDERFLRHVSPVFEAEALGYRSALVAMRVSEPALARAVAVVNAHPGVSHNYRREHAYNLWFTIAVPSGSHIEAHVRALRELAGAEDALVLPSLRRFKIGVSLDLSGERAIDERAAGGSGPARRQPARSDEPPSEADVAIIRAVQGDLPLVARPFELPAGAVGMTEGVLVAALLDLRRRGLLRRYAAIFRHREAGYSANGMAVWDVTDDRVEDVGAAMAGYTAISHCYERPRHPPAWPYNVFTMIHARSRDECDAFVAQLATQLDLPRHEVLYSAEEYKKVRPVYFSEAAGQWERTNLPA
jgi:DNA-binding Lrp family transcriptional regulator